MALVLLVVGLGLLAATLWPSSDPSGRTGSGADAVKDQGLTQRVPPVNWDQKLQQQIARAPVLTGASAAGAGVSYTGKMELARQTARWDGSRELRVWADAPAAPGAKSSPGKVLLQVYLDDQGRVTQTRVLGHRDADTDELEALLDQRK